MTRAGRIRAAAAASLVLATASGCGQEPPKTVVEGRVVQRADVQRLPAGTPQRAAMELARFVQWDDPVATHAVLSRRWRMTDAKVAAFLQTAGEAKDFRVPRILRTARHGDRAVITARVRGSVARLDFVREDGQWKLDRLRFPGVDLPRAGGSSG